MAHALSAVGAEPLTERLAVQYGLDAQTLEEVRRRWRRRAPLRTVSSRGASPPASDARSALASVRGDLIAGDGSGTAGGLPSHSGDRCVVIVCGSPRPIRLDTQDAEAERLNGLVREVRQADCWAKKDEIVQQARLATLGNDLGRLKAERLHFDMEVEGWKPLDWRSINSRRPQTWMKDALHGMTSEQKRLALKSIERAAIIASAVADGAPRARAARSSVRTSLSTLRPGSGGQRGAHGRGRL